MACKESDSGLSESCEQRECLQDVELSLVIPLYNEMDNVEPLYQAICDSLDVTRYHFELIFVDDGSEDGTLSKLESLIQRDPRVRVLRLLSNFGQTAAMRVGIDHARGEVIVTMDGDLQNDPIDIPVLVSMINEGYDLVVGWRKNRQDRPFTGSLVVLKAGAQQCDGAVDRNRQAAQQAQFAKLGRLSDSS